jgi:ATP-dependent DNA helicase RecG
MRSGEALVPMSQDVLRRIFEEAGPDFSAEICTKATLDDLDPEAISLLRKKWLRKSGNERILNISDEQLLSDLELLDGGGVTYAALILLGTDRALGRYLDRSEVIFEYRSTEASGPAQQRVNFRKGYLLYENEIWELINLRNDLQHFQDGFFMLNVPTFNETVAREAINNAVCHREYRHAGSVFVRQYPRKLVVNSPGGLPPGITLENILWQHAPRNRRLVQVFEKCGIVERAGQGVNLMFEYAIRETKPQPDFSATDQYFVTLTLPGEVQDSAFLRFLEKVGAERISSFTTEDFLLLDLINREQPISESLRLRAARLIDLGVVEKGGGRRFVLSRGLYSFLGKKGVYTRKQGLDRETNKALLLKHIQDNASEGSPFAELEQVLPALSRRQLQRLVQEMRRKGAIHNIGVTRGARWYPGKVVIDPMDDAGMN